MEKAKLFTAFYHLSELRSREDLIKGIIENIDYSMFASPHSWKEFTDGDIVMATRESFYPRRLHPVTRYRHSFPVLSFFTCPLFSTYAYTPRNTLAR